MATASFLGRDTAGTGDPEVLSTATAKTLLDLTGTDCGDQNDHGALPGLGDDDHTQYLLVGGSRAMTGSLNMGGQSITSLLRIEDAHGNTVLDFISDAAAVNYVQIQSQAATGPPRINFNGSDTNIDGVLQTKGSGVVKVRYSGVAYEVATLTTAQTLTNKTFAAGSGSTIDAALLTSGTVPIARVPTGATGSTVPFGDDARFSDAREPTAHATSHKDGGADEIATTTAAANAIPKAGASGMLDKAWMPGGDEWDYVQATTTYYTALYLLGSTSGVALSTKALVANRAHAVPFIAPRRGGTIDQLQIRITTGVAATNVRCGIYTNASETDLRPDSLVLDAGAGSSATSSSTITLSISQALTPGMLYWLVLLSDGAPTVRAGSANACIPIMGFAGATVTAMHTHLYATVSYGALPASFPTTLTAATGGFPSAFARFSA